MLYSYISFFIRTYGNVSTTMCNVSTFGYNCLIPIYAFLYESYTYGNVIRQFMMHRHFHRNVLFLYSFFIRTYGNVSTTMYNVSTFPYNWCIDRYAFLHVFVEMLLQYIIKCIMFSLHDVVTYFLLKRVYNNL